MWSEPSPAECFVERRRRLATRLHGPCVLGSGIARVRNFEGNRFAFRAESHFLYFVGRHIEEALLVFDAGTVTLFVEPPDPDDALWHGPEPSLEELAEQLQLDVRPIDEFSVPQGAATLPPGDVESSLWLEEVLGRAVEAGNVAANELDVELARVMVEVRLRHDSAALNQMSQAAAVTARAHRSGMVATRPGRREAQVRAAIEAEMTACGMIPAYNSIVTVHGEVLHHGSSTHLMNAGDLLLVDAGAESAEGWASDVTRTWPVSGKYSGVQAEVYDAVLASQLAAIAMCRPGVRFRDVHRRAAEVLVSGLCEIGLLRGSPSSLLERGAGSVFFPHGIGHLLGLDVHDMEDLGDLAGYAPGRQRSDEPAERYLRLDRDLEPGMVVTIEPGFYRIGHLLGGPPFAAIADAVDGDKLAALSHVRGIRIEDDVLITEDGHHVLSADVPKQRADVEAAIAG